MAKKQIKKNSEHVEPEKTEKIVKPKKYAKTQDAICRINKSKVQRIFVLSATREEDHWSFGVQGTKQKNYRVTINQTVKCTCMDFTIKKKPCKHIYFIVTQVAQNDEILDYFKNSTSISKSAYKVLDDQLAARLKSRLETMSKGTEKKDINLKDDTDCVICFTQMNKDEQKLEDCSTCTKYFHEQCIARWKLHNPTCPLCRGNLVCLGEKPLDKLKNIVV